MDEPNTLLIGLLQLQRAGCLVKLRQYSGELIEVAEHTGNEALQVLSEVLQDVKIIKAQQCIIFSNVDFDVHRMNYKRSEERWVRKGKMWFLQFDEQEITRFQRDNALKFVIMRQLFQFNRWKYVQVTEDKLSSTRRLLDAS